jgi:uncharacterized protein YeaO (DUF488 family)
MAIHVVRLGSPRTANEGPRLGTVRRPPRGVPKSEFASRNYYDLWFPLLAPSVETVKFAQGAKTEGQWAAFARKYRAEMKAPDAARTIALLALLSRETDLAVGCYCADPAHCHRSVLRELLEENGAIVAPVDPAVPATNAGSDAAGG